MIFVRRSNKSIGEGLQDFQHRMSRAFPGGGYEPSSREIRQLQAEDWRNRMRWHPPQQAAKAVLPREQLDQAVNDALERIKKKRLTQTDQSANLGFELEDDDE